ncbi:hypothetical protein ACQ4PT_009511 [Festuca glaucescens]
MDSFPSRILLTTLTILVVLVPPNAALLPSLDIQAGALLAWKATLSNQSQHALRSWGNMSTLCSWRGIRCGMRQHRPMITSIYLRGMRLGGTLESLDFSVLRTLTSLDLSCNSLAGSISPSIEVLGELHALLLQGNQIRGSIPPSLANLTKLHSLMLHDNQISGEIPRQIGKLSSLVSLNLSSNQLIGNIPCEIGNLMFLELAYSSRVTEKCDVYSFGVLKLELFMGHHPGGFLSSMADKSTPFEDLLDIGLPLPEA